jgi:hypothetical protein
MNATLLWVESPAELARFREGLAAASPDEPYDEVLCRAAPQALHHPPEHRTWALHRAQLLLSIPAVQEKAAARHTEWRRIATDFVAGRLGTRPDDLVAIATGHAVLAATLAAHEYWLAHPREELPDIMRQHAPAHDPAPGMSRPGSEAAYEVVPYGGHGGVVVDVLAFGHRLVRW